MTTTIHPTAIIDKKAILDENVTVGAYSIIGARVKLGAGCKVGPHVVIDGKTTIGKNNTFFQFASVGAIPQDLKYHGEDSELIIGDNNVIRESVTMHLGTEGGGMVTKVGNNNLFMAYTHIAHDCLVGDFNIFANASTLAGHVTVTNRVILGGLSAVHQFARIGEYAILGGGAMVGKDVPNYCIARGDHAVLYGINVIALERNGFTAENIALIRKVYRKLFLRGAAIEKKISELDENVKANPYIASWIEFLRLSERGICKVHRAADE
ncbi:MAG: acyl-ACP--UDP-N-acetylglucosamine O-acyltransferase [Deltaproteobacteria bacterium]|jgi:UDP-N-acetylglucosamine acyltransferase|nr:acyl-ACP--UDP-N-acetylglucosamine O-acyltransferase [Deltaproteobacteria bacterium]